MTVATVDTPTANGTTAEQDFRSPHELRGADLFLVVYVDPISDNLVSIVMCPPVNNCVARILETMGITEWDAERVQPSRL